MHSADKLEGGKHGVPKAKDGETYCLVRYGHIYTTQLLGTPLACDAESVCISFASSHHDQVNPPQRLNADWLEEKACSKRHKCDTEERRAKLGSKAISTLVAQKDVARFQSSLGTMMKGNMDALKRPEKEKKKKDKEKVAA